MKILNNNRKPNSNTIYMRNNKFYSLVAKFFTDFDQYLKRLRVKLVVALLSYFFKKVTFYKKANLLAYINSSQRCTKKILSVNKKSLVI